MSSIVIKIFSCDGTGAVRRRKFDTNSVTLAQVQEVANLQSNSRLTWRDEDNDIIQIETQADLQEAILSSVARNSSLRLFVDQSAPTASSASPRPIQAQQDHCSVKAWLRRRGQELLSRVNHARSVFESSGAMQAIKEDVCSIRAVFEARVERNQDSCLPIIKYSALAVLMWALVFPKFWLLLNIAIGAALMPRNALNHETYKPVRNVFALLGIRLALKLILGFIGFFLSPFLFIGLGCCLVPKILLGVAFCRCLCKKGGNRRRQRCQQHRQQQRQQQRQQKRQQKRQQEREVEEADIATLSKIFPDVQLAQLRQKYMVHKNLQQTVTELLG